MIGSRTTQSSQSARRNVRSAVSAVSAVIVIAVAACGKKGPPLPPLVRLPVAPANVTVDRRGDSVEVGFTVPDANNDRTRPANIERVDVYGITAPPTITDDQLLKHATKIGSVAVKSPRDPNDVVPADSPDAEIEPAVGAGVDQGAAAHVTETLDAAAFQPADLGKDARAARQASEEGGPLIGPPPAIPARTYVAVGVTTRGKRGPLSKRATAPLIGPPPAPAPPKVTYTEQEITIAWPAIRGGSGGDADVLPSQPIGAAAPQIGYNVYDVSAAPRKLNAAPVTGTTLTDSHVTWGEKRCYAVRAVETVAGASVESDASAPACKTLTDTFPPAAPKGLRSVAGDRTISLIWDPNTEADLAGYLVFRGTGADLQPVTPAPIQDTTFTDAVQPGAHYVYAIKAVDKAGNASPYSERVEETARE